MKKVEKRIIQALEGKEIPWRTKWHGTDANCGLPTNIVSHKKYSGIDLLLLQLTTSRANYKSKWWGTYYDFKALGFEVKPSVEMGTDISKGIVYNLDQLESGLDELRPFPSPLVNYDKAEKLVESANVKIKFSENKEAAYYYPPADYIAFPFKEMFEHGPGGLPGYYDSMFHELAHWTEIPLKFRFKVKCYDQGLCELRAEIVSGFLCSELKTPHGFSRRNHDKWLSKWLIWLKSYPGLVHEITDSACKSSDYLLSLVK